MRAIACKGAWFVAVSEEVAFWGVSMSYRYFRKEYSLRSRCLQEGSSVLFFMLEALCGLVGRCLRLRLRHRVSVSLVGYVVDAMEVKFLGRGLFCWCHDVHTVVDILRYAGMAFANTFPWMIWVAFMIIAAIPMNDSLGGGGRSTLSAKP